MRAARWVLVIGLAVLVGSCAPSEYVYIPLGGAADVHGQVVDYTDAPGSQDGDVYIHVPSTGTCPAEGNCAECHPER